MSSKSRLRPVRGLPERRAANDVVSGAVDQRVGRALAALEARPDERWTVAKLGKIAGLSRAAFARRFAAEVGVPPQRYLTALRMHRAAELLATTGASLADIASSVGYANEFALSRAFRRVIGEPPGVYRRLVRAAPRSFQPRCLAA
jgi:transcriptional regulator GlxA family with amidase domain